MSSPSNKLFCIFSYHTNKLTFFAVHEQVLLISPASKHARLHADLLQRPRVGRAHQVDVLLRRHPLQWRAHREGGLVGPQEL